MLWLTFPSFMVAALIAAAFTRVWWGAAIAAALGIVLALGFVLLAYLAGWLSNAPDPSPGGDVDLTLRDLVTFVVVIGSVGWFLGVGAVVVTRLVRRALGLPPTSRESP